MSKNNSFRFLVLFSLFFLTFGCSTEQGGGEKNTTQEKNNAPLTFEKKVFVKKSKLCETDSNNCAIVSATYPFAQGGDQAVRTMINDSIAFYLRNIMAVFSIDETDVPQELDILADQFILEYEELVGEEPGFSSSWSIETEGEVLYQSSKLACIELSTYSFAGGAHPNSELTLLNFDLKTGKILQIEDFISDMGQLEQLAEKAFRKSTELGPNDSLNEAGFFWGDSFHLPRNVAINAEGLNFYYNPYEVAAYAFGVIEFSISFKELDTILKKKLF